MKVNYVCPKCYKSMEILSALDKLTSCQGYEQCKDCHADLEYESVVIRQIHYNNLRFNNIPLPEWLEKEQIKNEKKSMKLAKSLSKIKMPTVFKLREEEIQ